MIIILIITSFLVYLIVKNKEKIGQFLVDLVNVVKEYYDSHKFLVLLSIYILFFLSYLLPIFLINFLTVITYILIQNKVIAFIYLEISTVLNESTGFLLVRKKFFQGAKEKLKKSETFRIL